MFMTVLDAFLHFSVLYMIVLMHPMVYYPNCEPIHDRFAYMALRICILDSQLEDSVTMW